MDVLEQADPHHVGNAAGVIPTALVLLQSVQEGLGVARLDAEDRENEAGNRNCLDIF
jgi:hypothetical protein